MRPAGDSVLLELGVNWLSANNMLDYSGDDWPQPKKIMCLPHWDWEWFATFGPINFEHSLFLFTAWILPQWRAYPRVQKQVLAGAFS